MLSRTAYERHCVRAQKLQAEGGLQALRNRLEAAPWLAHMHKFRCELKLAESRAAMMADLLVYWDCELAALERKFDPNQPRVPRGNLDGGQWTYVEGYARGRALQDFRDYLRTGRVRVAESGTMANDVPSVVPAQYQGNPRKYSPVLEDEEIAGGHTIRDHVAKSDAELLKVLNENYYDYGIAKDFQEAEGSFVSIESANDFVNQILKENQATVDMVANGMIKDYAKLEKRFGYVTGKEAFRPDENSAPYMRPTYSVRVIIYPAPDRERGYRVHTAFPINQDPK